MFDPRRYVSPYPYYDQQGYWVHSSQPQDKEQIPKPVPLPYPPPAPLQPDKIPPAPGGRQYDTTPPWSMTVESDIDVICPYAAPGQSSNMFKLKYQGDYMIVLDSGITVSVYLQGSKNPVEKNMKNGDLISGLSNTKSYYIGDPNGAKTAFKVTFVGPLRGAFFA